MNSFFFGGGGGGAPGDGMVIIVTLSTQVRKEKNVETNFRPGTEPGTPRLGVRGWQIRQRPLVVHREEWRDRLLSWVMAWCLVCWTPSLWVPGSVPGRKFVSISVLFLRRLCLLRRGPFFS